MKKLLALILVLVMVLSIAPLGVLAQEGTEEEKTPAEELFTLEPAEEQVQTPQAEEPEVKALLEKEVLGELEGTLEEEPEDKDPVGELKDEAPANESKLSALETPINGNGYTVHYYPNGGTGDAYSVDSPTTVAENTFTAPAGKKFAKWNTDDAGAGKDYHPGDAISKASTLYAIWEDIISYTVKFYDGDTELTDLAKEVEEGGKVSKPSTTPTKEGYNFEDWYADSSFGTKFDFDNTPISKNTNIYAKFNPITYKIKFDKSSDIGTTEITGSVPSDITATYDVETTIPACDLKRDYYSFAGWTTTEGGKEAEFTTGSVVKNLSTKQDGEVTLYAVWKPQTLTITFVGNGGQTKDKAPEYTQTFDYDGAATLTANQFTKSYFKFVEWKDENGNTYANEALFNPNQLIEGKITELKLTAQWEMRQYNITVKFYLYSEKNGKYVHTEKDVGSGYATFEHILAKDIKDGTQIPFNYASFPPEKTFYFTAKDGYTLTYIEKTKTGQYPVTSTDGTLTVSSMEDTVGCTIKVYFKVSKSAGGGVGAALTGDDFGTWVALAGISLLGATGTGIMYKKRRREQ